MIIVLAASLQAQWSNDPNNNLIIGYGLNPDLCSDSAGGCYITYEYGTTGYPRKLGLERLDKYGFKPWGTLKQIPGELPEQWYAEIIEDGEGGVIISYLDDLISGSDFIYRVRVQRVDSTGNLLWGPTGVRVTTAEINHGNQALVSDGNGGCIVIWPQVLQNYTYDYRANRINNLGEKVWGDTGIFLENSIYNDAAVIIRASDGNYYVQIRTSLYRLSQKGQIIRQDSVTLGYPVPDAEGGVLLSGRVGSINNRRLVAQRKDSLGNNLWQEPYVEVADSLDINTHLEIKYNNGFIYYSWSGKKNGIDKVVQFQALRLDGTKLFSDGSIRIGIPPLGGAYIVPLEKNRTSFIYHETNYLPDSLLAQTYDTLGNKLWDTSGVLISHPSIEYQSFTTDGCGGFIIGGVIDNFTVVAQQINRYGYLGEIITNVAAEETYVALKETSWYQNYPNPFNSSTIIKYQIPTVETHRDASLQLVKLIVYDVLGNEVATLVNEEKPAGEYEIEFTATGLSSGIYFYKLEAGNFIQTRKMTLLK